MTFRNKSKIYIITLNYPLFQMMAQEGGGTVTIQQAPTPSQEAADTVVTTPMVVEEEAGFSATENPSEVLPSPPLERPVAPPPPNSVTPTLVPVPPPNSVLVPVPPPNSVMVPVPPPTSVMVPVPKPEFLMNHSPSVAKAQAPPKKATIIPSPSPAATNKSFQPIRVDNWGIVLLNRLQTYFQKKEHTDLTIRFPAQNAQMKVHKLVMHACTDYFLNAEIEGRLVQDDGGGLTIDMTPDFTPDAVAPIVRFMYTGKLDLRASMFAR